MSRRRLHAPSPRPLDSQRSAHTTSFTPGERCINRKADLTTCSAFGGGAGTEDLSADGRRGTQMRLRWGIGCSDDGSDGFGSTDARSRVERERCANRRCLFGLLPNAGLTELRLRLRTNAGRGVCGHFPQGSCLSFICVDLRPSAERIRSAPRAIALRRQRGRRSRTAWRLAAGESTCGRRPPRLRRTPQVDRCFASCDGTAPRWPPRLVPVRPPGGKNPTGACLHGLLGPMALNGLLIRRVLRLVNVA
jgi:hypothetical protein